MAILGGFLSVFVSVEQLMYLVDLCPLMRSWSPGCLICSTLDMTVTVLSNAIGFSYAGFFRAASRLKTLEWENRYNEFSILSSEAKLGLSSQLWPNLTTGQIKMRGIAALLLLHLADLLSRSSLLKKFVFTIDAYIQRWILVVLIYLLHWVNGIPALAHVIHIFATLG